MTFFKWAGREIQRLRKVLPSTNPPQAVNGDGEGGAPDRELTATEAKPLGERGPWWGDDTVPQSYGAAESAITMGTVASPFLAGFSLAAYIQTLSISTTVVRWRGPSLILFLLAASLLIFTVQSTFLARRHLVTPKDLMDWWPDWAQPYRRQDLSDMLREDNKRYRRWTNFARLLFGSGVLSLLCGLTLLAVPPDSPCQPTTRWVAVCLGVLAIAVEASWLGYEIKHWVEKRETLGAEVHAAEATPGQNDAGGD
ncbi:hypothetical protein [Streptomyces griseosporeus]|uniref:hypothetical protein n=1 Tax=Streptomyces griseosporeus TaxID=1910 RepID=UPI0037A3A5AB